MPLTRSDGLTAYRQPPMVVVLPETTEQVSTMLKYCHETNRASRSCRAAAGTSLSGGALPLADGVLLGLGKFNRVLEIDYANRCAVVQPGVTNLGDHQGGGRRGLLLRARSVLADRLHDRRQRRGEFRRRALPEIRLTTNNVLGIEMVLMTARSCASAASISIPRAMTCWADHRFGRAAGRRHRGHRAHPAQA
jgi:glycolate oxidase